MFTQDDPHNGVTLQTTAQFTKAAPWRLDLLHDCPDYLLIWITKGQGLAVLHGMRHGIGAHTALLIPKHTLFSVDLGRTGAGLVLTLTDAVAMQMRFPEDTHILRLRDVHIQKELTGHLDRIQFETQQQAPFAEDAIHAHGALLSVFLRRILHSLPETARPSGAQRLVRAFCALVSQEYARGYPMAEYARMLGVTPTHLTRSCKECCGVTAADILTARSLYAARERIETTSQSFKSIGEDLGFGSPAYFSRFIQNHTGHAPSALRKSARNRLTSAR